MSDAQFLAPAVQRRRGGARALAPAAPPRRVRRAGAGQGAARDRARRRRRRAARRSTTSCSPARRASARRASRTSSARSSASASARSPGPALERKGDIAAILTALEAARRALRRRDPPAEPRGRGDPLPGARGLPARHRRRPGAGGADAHARPAAVHARRRDDAHRPADDAAARPLRDDVPARLLRARRARRRSSAARPRILGVEIADEAADEIAAPLARHAAHREPHPPPRARRRRGAPRRARSRSTIAARGARAARGRRARARAHRPRAAARDRREVRRRARSASRRSRSRSARSRTRSRTSTSRTCSSSASSSARRAAASITELGRAHVGAAPRRKTTRVSSEARARPGRLRHVPAEARDRAHPPRRRARPSASSSSPTSRSIHDRAPGLTLEHEPDRPRLGARGSSSRPKHVRLHRRRPGRRRSRARLRVHRTRPSEPGFDAPRDMLGATRGRPSLDGELHEACPRMDRARLAVRAGHVSWALMPDLWIPVAEQPHEAVRRAAPQGDRVASPRSTGSRSRRRGRARDGRASSSLQRLEPEPGFGIVTLCPYDEHDPDDGPRRADRPDRLAPPDRAAQAPGQPHARFGFARPAAT